MSIIILLGMKAEACSQLRSSLPVACRLLSWWPSSFIRLQCDVVAWQQWAKQRKGKGESRGADYSESTETSKEKHIILLCTVCRLNLHNSDTQQHKKRAKSLKYVLRTTNKGCYSVEKNTLHLSHCDKFFRELKQIRNSTVNVSYYTNDADAIWANQPINS